jgi:hypothetical protein
MTTDSNLQRRLDAYVGGECGSGALSDELLAHCAAAPRATWEVLALLDQYQRRGKLPLDLHRSISQRIQRRALGMHADGASAGAERTTGGYRVVAEVAANQALMLPTAAPVNGDDRSGLTREIQSLRKELRAARSLAAAYLEQLKSQTWQHPATELPVADVLADAPAAAATPRRRPTVRRPTRSVQAVSFVVLMLALGASQRLGEREHAPLPPRPAPVPSAVRVPVPGRLSLAADSFIVQPGGRSAQITVERAAGTDGAVSFQWWTQNAGARAGVDFRAQPLRRVTIPAGVNSLQLSVPIRSNPARRHTEMFYVAIGKPQGGAALGEPLRAAVFIMRR